MEATDMEIVLLEAVESLLDSQKAVFLLNYLDQMSLHEISRWMGINPTEAYELYLKAVVCILTNIVNIH